jgi:hypothetical protein
MLKSPELPRNLCLKGKWAISVTDIAGSGPKAKHEHPLEAVVVSQESLVGYFLFGIFLQPKGTSGAEIQSRHVTSVEGKDAEWGEAYLPKEVSNPISPAAVYDILNKVNARKLLSGHLLAIRYNAITRMREFDEHLDVASRWEKEFKFTLGQGEESLTKFTAISYKALTDWLETSPAQLLASIEGVSVTTIRNRIYAAREIGAIGKPGAGIRSAKKPNAS